MIKRILSSIGVDTNIVITVIIIVIALMVNVPLQQYLEGIFSSSLNVTEISYYRTCQNIYILFYEGHKSSTSDVAAELYYFFFTDV